LLLYFALAIDFAQSKPQMAAAEIGFAIQVAT